MIANTESVVRDTLGVEQLIDSLDGIRRRYAPQVSIVEENY